MTDESPVPATPVDQSDAPGTTPAEQPGEDLVSRAIAWLIGLGVGSPSGPPEVGAYQLLLEHGEQSCREVLQIDLPDATESLYHGAAAACLAALHGKSERWAEAEAAFDSLGGRPEACLDRATYELLESIVLARRENPDAEFRVARSNTVPLPCPIIQDLTVARDSSGGLAISVSGDRLRRVRDVGVQFVSDCSEVIPEFGHAATSFTAERRSLQATVAAGDWPEDAELIWVGLVAEPQPWIAGHDCVRISGSPDPADDATPSSPSPPVETQSPVP